MTRVPVIVVSAEGEDDHAKMIAKPLEQAGYTVTHRGHVLVGESVPEETNKMLAHQGPVVMCATVRAIGTGWAHRVVHAARSVGSHRVFIVQMEAEAYVDQISEGTVVARFAHDPASAVVELIKALNKYYPPEGDGVSSRLQMERVEALYRERALTSHDIIDLANLPEDDRHIATRQLELRRLYVALRATVQPAAAGDKVWFNDLEGQRHGPRKAGSDQGDSGPVSIGERLTDARRLVVLGDPGSGKSTLLRWFATAYLLKLSDRSDWRDMPDVATLPDKDWLPLIVRCRDLDETQLNGSFTNDVIPQVLKKQELADTEVEMTHALLVERLREGTCLLLVDGLDEIATAATRSRFCEQLTKFHNAYPEAPIVVTSRIVGYREMGWRFGRDFEHLIMSDLTPEDKDDFATRWTALTEPVNRRERARNELVAAIHSTDRIERLASNPMLLTTMALVKRKVGKLPTRRAELYGEAVKVLLNWRSEVDAPLDQQEAFPQLQYLAYAMCDAGAQQLREDEVLRLLNQIREDRPNLYDVHRRTPSEFLRVLEHRTGILMESGRVRYRGHWVPVFEFRHLTFQEYLAGRALVDNCLPGRKPTSRLAERVGPLAGRVEKSRGPSSEMVISQSWREALRLCVASCANDEVDESILAILEPGPGDRRRGIRRARAVLAGQCLVDEPNCSASTTNAVLERLAAVIDDSDGSGPVITSVDQVSRNLYRTRWGDQFRDILLSTYCHTGGSRYSVGGLLATSTRPDESDPSAFQTRVASLVARYKQGDRIAGVMLALEVMDAAYEGWYRRTTGVVSVVLDLLSGPEYEVFAAVWALKWLRNPFRTGGKNRWWRPTPQQVRRIVDVYQNRFQSEELDGDLLAVFEELPQLDVKDAIMRRMLHPNLKARVSAIRLIWISGLTEAIPLVVDQLYQRYTPLRVESIRCLGLLKDSASAPIISRLVCEKDIRVRRAAVEVLGQLGDVRAQEALADVVTDRQLALSAVRALRELGIEQPPTALLMLVNDKDPNVRVMALNACAEFGYEAVRDVMRRALLDVEVKVRRAAVKALAGGFDETDRAILSVDIDGYPPFVDPTIQANERRVRALAKHLELDVGEIRRRLMSLSKVLGVQLIAPE